jgi:acetyl esterase
MRRWVIGLVAIVALVAGAFVLSPWPGVLVIRAIFNRGAAAASAKLEGHVPAAVTTTTAGYDAADSDAVLDIYRLPDARPGAPTVVWVHGGGFVSGRRQDVANYLKVLAGHGFAVVNIDYTIAPEARYPGPVQQVNAALAFLAREGEGLGIDPARMVLAGDSAGAQIAAQVAAVVTSPDHAQAVGIAPGVTPDRLVGVLLFCGVYDIGGMGQGGGFLGWFVQTTGWAYSGVRRWRGDAGFATINFTPHLTAAYPPAFVSAGNADPLGPQSVALAGALQAAGVPVETQFFPDNHAPPLGHEYQFDLDTEAGQTALARAVAWLNGL